MKKRIPYTVSAIIKIVIALAFGAAVSVFSLSFDEITAGGDIVSALSAGFAEGTTINGIDVSGLSAAGACGEFQSVLEDYSLKLTLTYEGVSEDETSEEDETEDETEVETDEAEETSDSESVLLISSSDISLSLADESVFETLLDAQREAKDALEEDEELSEEALALTADGILSYDESALSEIIEEFVSGFKTADEAASASIVYDEDEGEFVVVAETYGGEFSYESVFALSTEAVNTLTGELDLSSLIEVPAITADNETLLAALATANAYLKVELTYTFEVNSASVTISKEDILSWLVYDEESATINIDNEELSAYVDDLANEYSVYTSTSKFKTVSGSYISVNVSSEGQSVDSDSLYNDIYDNLTSLSSGTYAAPYSTSSVDTDSGIVDFDGTYVEVDLTNQHLYVFIDGVQVMDSAIVSGKVSDGHRTPTGVYTVKSKQTNRYLTGATYRSWVYFWMPFNGGIGFHDATWRSSFGGSIYLYSGSHGCINMPYANAKKLYNYISVGTYVIVYGGATSVEGKTQTVSVASSFTKTEGDSSFSLNASTSGDGELTYSSSDTSVVTVDSDGKVTIKGAGSATITVTASDTGTYKTASATTTITVKHNYKVSSASWGSDNSSCTLKITCSGCSASKTLTAKVTSAVTKEATQTETGIKTYTATATYDGTTFTAQTTETIAKLESTESEEETETETETETEAETETVTEETETE